MSDDDKVTSRAASLWDAIGGQYWDAASEIAWHSRGTFNPTWEHEDDFLHVWFVMNRYFLDTTKTEDEEDQAQRESRQRALLDRQHLPGSARDRASHARRLRLRRLPPR